MKPQPKKILLEFLKNVYPEWRSGSMLEAYNFGGKPSTTGRALRRLENEGKLEREYRPLEKRADEQVWYRFKPQKMPINDSMASGRVQKSVEYVENRFGRAIKQLSLI